MVSTSDWNAGGPVLIPGRSRLVILGVKKNSGRRLTLLNCVADHVMLCVTHFCLVRKKYPNVAQVGLCVHLRAKHASASADLKERRRRKRSPPVRLDQRCRHLLNLVSQKRRWRVCRIVVTSQWVCSRIPRWR